MVNRTKRKIPVPTGVDDLFVMLMRNRNPDYKSDDPRFSEKAMKRRSSASFAKRKVKFEQVYGK